MTIPHHEETSSSPSRIFLYCLLICAVGAAAYYNALGGEFVYDDAISMLRQSAVKTLDITTLWRAFNVRILGYLTFALNYKATGFDPFWFHLVNVVIHLANSCLVFWLVRLVIHRAANLDASRLGSRYADAVALTAALIFVAHPIETQAVTFMVQRLTSLAALFYLLSLILFFKGRICMDEGRRCGIALVVLSVLSAVAAMFTKQSAFTIPLALILVEFAFFSPSWKLMRQKMALFALAAVLLAVIPVALILFHGVSLQEITDISRASTLLGRYDYFATQINVVRTYLRLIVFPAGQRLDYAYPIFHSVFNERTILSAVLHLGLIAAAIASFRKKRAVFFGIAFFYITLLVEASVFPIQDVIVEHRIYLPSVGIIIAVSSLMWLAAKRMHLKGRSMWIIVGALVALLAVLTHQRNKAWADSETLWKDNVLKDPKSWRARYNLGKAYELQGRLPEARRTWEESTGLKESSWAWNNIANIYTMEGRYEEAIRAFRKSIKLNPTFLPPYTNMGIAMEKLGKPDEAISLNEKALSINPEYAAAYFNLGRIYLSKGNAAEGEKMLSKAIALEPGHADARFFLALHLSRTGRSEEARQQLMAALRADPDHKRARKLLRSLKQTSDGEN